MMLTFFHLRLFAFFSCSLKWVKVVVVRIQALALMMVLKTAKTKKKKIVMMMVGILGDSIVSEAQRLWLLGLLAWICFTTLHISLL